MASEKDKGDAKHTDAGIKTEKEEGTEGISEVPAPSITEQRC